MEISRKMFVAAMVIAVLYGVLFGYLLRVDNRFFHRSPRVTANVFVFKETPNGVEQLCSGNIITDIGERYIRNILGFNNETVAATKWISLGNSTIAQTKTKLDTEATTLGFARAEGTVVGWISGGDYAYNVSKKFTATGTISINAAGLHWNGTGNSDGNLFALGDLGGTQTFQANWNCTIIWVIVWNCN